MVGRVIKAKEIERKYFVNGHFVAEYIQVDNSIRIFDSVLNCLELKDFMRWAQTITQSTKIRIV